MTPEQKQRAMQMLRRFSQATPMTCTADNAAVAMAALLEELVDAPATEPVARVTGYYGGYLSIATVDGRVLPAGTALYAAPPHQSEHHLEMVNTPAPSVQDWQGWAMRLIDFIEGAEVSSGMCCCGDDMARHASPINCGHSPVDMWDNCVKNLRAEFDKFVAAAPTPAEAPADVARDAERYRWLRNENAKLGGGYYVGNDTDTMPGDITWIGSDLDAAIDAAISEKGGA